MKLVGLVEMGLAVVGLLTLVTGCVVAFFRARAWKHEQQRWIDDAFDRGRFQETNRQAMEEDRMVPRRGA